MGLDIVQFLENKTILVTGATGFLAKIFVEKILRVQPNVKKMYILIRATDKQTATRRLHEELIQKELFDVLRKEWPQNFNTIVGRLDPILGDVSCENFGVKDFYLRSEMWREIDIIVNSAATTKFNERYDIALAVNAFGAKYVAEFAARCANLKMLLHVSTAYVCGDTAGIIREKAFSMGDTPNGSRELDVNEEKLLVEGLMDELREKSASQEEINIALKDLGLQRARLHGWPNTYTLTKAMGEMMVQHHLKQNIPLVVMRPTIVTSTYQEPFAGWIEGFPLRNIDSIAINYGRGKLNSFVADPDTVLDLIPADMVVNAMIVAMAVHANQPSLMIYHVGSSMCNPFRVADFLRFIHRYFSDNPLTNEAGRLVKVGKFMLLDSMESFQMHLSQYYRLQSKEQNSFQSFHSDLKRNMNMAMQVAEIYRPYSLFKGIFNDTNTKALRAMAIENGIDMESTFSFDPSYIDWEDYFQRIHLPGISSTFKLKRAML